MSLKNSVNTNKLEGIDEALEQVGLKDDKKHVSEKKKNINKVETKKITKTKRLSTEVPINTHMKFAMICLTQETTLQEKSLELIEEFVRNETIAFED